MERLGVHKATESRKRAAEADHSGSARDVSVVKVGDCLLGYKAALRRARGGHWNHFRGRMREIEKLIRHRHGDIVPEADDALIYVEVIASLALVEFGQDFVDVVLGWAARWLPWAGKADVEEIIYERTKVRFSALSADALGHALHVSYAERCALDIRTIGAFDVPKAKRARLQKEKRRKRDRSRKEEQRRAAGALPRADYLANSFSQARPWDALGISRRTWERRGKPMPGAEAISDCGSMPLAA
ncbi:hypothetical protein EOS93_22745 [Rhizobium sp. RMa-01]|uniref:hypothetical protein n=1 Tax=unclassified Rhizobium TaxID=2613769 RepID=UPI0008DB065E|nr:MULTISPECIES: hypothetical protein [unclassified Rhizobium]OHV24739.1 hypothetical protein BBJ66_23780 [Rhizobium sp. RSm-3]RVU08733.1 hypothetical protein EOS93_22745 [Rhizobium sp. RMa-01]